MKLPFTTTDFFNVFVKYNVTVFPLQVIFVLLALLIVVVIIQRRAQYYRYIWIALGFLWAWMGIVYHIGFFSPINPIAKIFGLVFILEAILLIFMGIRKNPTGFNYQKGTGSFLGLGFIAYALVIYPVITTLTGHGYPALPTFGVPCPTTIYSLGVFLLADLRKTPKKLFVIPIIWTLIATSAAINLDVYADSMLIISSILFIVTVVSTKKNRSSV